MDGAEFCSKVVATIIQGGNGDIAWHKTSTPLVRPVIASSLPPPAPALPSEVDRRNLLLAERKEKELLLLQ